MYISQMIFYVSVFCLEVSNFFVVSNKCKILKVTWLELRLSVVLESSHFVRLAICMDG